MRMVAFILLCVLLAGGAGFWALRFSDGPVGPLPGGPLRAGPLETRTDVDWGALIPPNTIKVVEFQLENPVSSRLAGVFVHEGALYVACDLGFIGRRAPGVVMGVIQSIVLSLKNWHLHAEKDGRVVLRVKGVRYPLLAERVTDPALLDPFRAQAEENAVTFFGGLKPIETNPEDIWFFRLTPRRR